MILFLFLDKQNKAREQNLIKKEKKKSQNNFVFLIFGDGDDFTHGQVCPIGNSFSNFFTNFPIIFHWFFFFFLNFECIAHRM